MSDTNQFYDQIFDDFTPKKKMPDMLNVLTILTFIASGISLVYAPISYVMICKQAEKMQGDIEKVGGGSGFLANFMRSSMDAVQRSCENRMPILIITLVFLIACIVGAILMRQLKKNGYFIYLIGEIGLPVATLVLVGGSSITVVFAFFFPILFLILYGTQLKHMK